MIVIIRKVTIRWVRGGNSLVFIFKHDFFLYMYVCMCVFSFSVLFEMHTLRVDDSGAKVCMCRYIHRQYNKLPVRVHMHI